VNSNQEIGAEITSATHLIYINARNNSTSGPRRGWIVMNDYLKVGFFDEGYEGYNSVPLCFQGLPGFRSSYILVHPSEYKDALKLNK